MEFDIAADFKLRLLPAHFLHSEGQINTYDPVSKILFTGDIGAAMLPNDSEYEFVDHFAPPAFYRRLSPPLQVRDQGRAVMGGGGFAIENRHAGAAAWADLPGGANHALGS